MKPIKVCLLATAAAVGAAGCGGSSSSGGVRISPPDVRIAAKPIVVTIPDISVACQKPEAAQGSFGAESVVERRAEAIQRRRPVRRFACDGSVASFKIEDVGPARALVRLSRAETGADHVVGARVYNRRSCLGAQARQAAVLSGADAHAPIPAAPAVTGDGELEFIVSSGLYLQIGNPILAWPGVNFVDVEFQQAGAAAGEKPRVRRLGVRLDVQIRTEETNEILDVPATDCPRAATNESANEPTAPQNAGQGEGK